jgi:hypothetical protein
MRASSPNHWTHQEQRAVKTFLSLALSGLLLTAAPAAAEDAFTLPKGEPITALPGQTYDPAIPTLDKVAGHPFGADFTPYADLRRYFEALAAAAPERSRLIEIGKSWQGRKLFALVIGSPANIARLDAIQADMQTLADPRASTTPQAQALMAKLPAVVWLAHAVHGDEIGVGDAAALTAYHLLAARNDPAADKIRDNTLVIVNPVQNPDGRERFIASNTNARGLEADGAALSAERDQPWPGGRFNHYVFDLNRDWFAQTQPETRAHTAAVLRWKPQILADIHEMGTESTYFFPPAADPTNPLQTKAQMAARDRIGRAIAQAFDRDGRDYFTREVYDLFYPGYGDGWPSYHGAVTMTFEQGSARGLVARRRSGEMLTFAETVKSQTIASLALTLYAAENRQGLLQDFRAYRESAMAQGRASKSRLRILPADKSPAAAARLAALLARQGVEVNRATQSFSACGKSFQAGTYVIDQAQPAGRMVEVLTDARIDLDAAFAKEQERRRARGLPDQIYDVTAWSLPLLHNLEFTKCGAALPANVSRIGPDHTAPGALDNADAKVAYLVRWGDIGGVRFLTAALREGLMVKSADAAFTHGGVRYPAGSLILDVADNPSASAKIATLAKESGAQVTGVDDSWVTDGPSFGSSRVQDMPAPRVAMAWDWPAARTAAGSTRYTLERKFGWPVTAIRGDRLRNGDLSGFDVLVLPAQERSYMDTLGESGAKRLKDWVRAGGVLIALGDASAFLADPKSGLSALRREDLALDKDADEDKPEKPDEDAKTVPGTLLKSAADLKKATRPIERTPDAVAGVIARASVDDEHWLGAGAAAQVNALVSGPDIYAPLRLDDGVNVVSFKSADELLASGYLWEENRKQLAFKPMVTAEETGRGIVIAFTADPTTRGFVDGLDVLFANAVFRGAAHAERAR